MTAITSLIVANIAIWIGFAGYFIYLSQKQQSLTKRINTIQSQISSD